MKAVWRDRLKLQNYISGLFIEPDSRVWMDDYSPATGEIIGQVPKSQRSDVDRAVKAAKDALPYWSSLTNIQRADWLHKIADNLESKYEDIAHLESKDTGKPISLAREVDAYRSVKNFRFFGEIIRT